MTLNLFKEKYGYEIAGMWLPRVTALITGARKSLPLESEEGYPNSFVARFGLMQAAAWGTLMHEAVETIVQGKEYKPDAKITIAIEAFREWHKEHPLRLLDSENDIERRVFDLKSGYAGTLDIIAEVQGKVSVIDVKTSTAILSGHSLQTAAYLNAYNQSIDNGNVCEGRWILRIDQYQECKGCYAKKREKYGRARVAGGNPMCNHQWTRVKGEVEFKELKNQEKDLAAFFVAKRKWEEKQQDWLAQIPNFPKNNRQAMLL